LQLAGSEKLLIVVITSKPDGLGHTLATKVVICSTFSLFDLNPRGGSLRASSFYAFFFSSYTRLG
jgi:hypothetical protein